jgi:transcriptional regulator with XRE-family HTH domain
MERAATAEERYRAACATVFRRLRAAHGWSLREFGDQVGAAHTTLYAVERAEATPGIDLLDRVGATAGLDLRAMLRLIVAETGPESGDVEQPSLLDLLEALDLLTPQQRADVLTFVAYVRYRDRDNLG